MVRVPGHSIHCHVVGIVGVQKLAGVGFRALGGGGGSGIRRERSATITSEGEGTPESPNLPVLFCPHPTVLSQLSWGPALAVLLTLNTTREEGLRGRGWGWGWAGEPSWRVRGVCPEESEPGRSILLSLSHGGGCVWVWSSLWMGRQSREPTCSPQTESLPQ